MIHDARCMIHTYTFQIRPHLASVAWALAAAAALAAGAAAVAATAITAAPVAATAATANSNNNSKIGSNAYAASYAASSLLHDYMKLHGVSGW